MTAAARQMVDIREFEVMLCFRRQKKAGFEVEEGRGRGRYFRPIKLQQLTKNIPRSFLTF